MSIGRVVSSLTASAAVAGCAVVAFGMARADTTPSADHRRAPVAAFATPRPAVILATPASAPPRQHAATGPGVAASPVRPVQPDTSAPTTAPTTAPIASPTADVPAARPSSPKISPRVRATRPATSAATRPDPPSAPASTAHPTPSHPTPSHPISSHPKTTAPPKPKPKQPTKHHKPAVHHKPVSHGPAGQRLPVHKSTGNARKVITVTAHSHSSTTATLQAWSKVSGGGWRKHGSSVTADIGSDGMTKHASESRSATPIGSFTLTHAFGHDANPGTSLPYRHTIPSDWWISQPGRLYNTHQRCSSGCAFNQGSPNEHLYYETPYYDYAVVIDYNTRNAPGGVHQGKGSAFFLHVSVGEPTAGCVSIPMTKLVSIMRWLTPSAHPRILIGVT